MPSSQTSIYIALHDPNTTAINAHCAHVVRHHHDLPRKSLYVQVQADVRGYMVNFANYERDGYFYIKGQLRKWSHGLLLTNFVLK